MFVNVHQELSRLSRASGIVETNLTRVFQRMRRRCGTANGGHTRYLNDFLILTQALVTDIHRYFCSMLSLCFLQTGGSIKGTGDRSVFETFIKAIKYIKCLK